MTNTLVARRRWSDLTPQQQAAIGVAGLLQVTLMILALVDVRRRPAAQINGNKRLWTLAAFINFIGPIAYFLFGRKRGEGNS